MLLPERSDRRGHVGRNNRCSGCLPTSSSLLIPRFTLPASSPHPGVRYQRSSIAGKHVHLWSAHRLRSDLAPSSTRSASGYSAWSEQSWTVQWRYQSPGYDAKQSSAQGEKSQSRASIVSSRERCCVAHPARHSSPSSDFHPPAGFSPFPPPSASFRRSPALIVASRSQCSIMMSRPIFVIVLRALPTVAHNQPILSARSKNGHEGLTVEPPSIILRAGDVRVKEDVEEMRAHLIDSTQHAEGKTPFNCTTVWMIALASQLFTATASQTRLECQLRALWLASFSLHHPSPGRVPAAARRPGQISDDDLNLQNL